ncbi:MAG: hypothetical protein K2N94_04625, partial [Lachnospiraceae bacterium]|nr:hypothetical protein [Lachnospiraceae bacterium]
LSEKTIHAVLKNYYVPDANCHEQRLAGFVADAYTGREIYEIQTRNFNTLRRKLDAFLPLCNVNIVYPVAHTKYLRYIDRETGAVTAPRKSPKTGTPYAVFQELYRIKNYLLHEHIHIRIALLDVEEYRFLEGPNRNRRKGATKSDAFPLTFHKEIVLNSPADYAALLPDGLPDAFTTKDFKTAARVSQPLAAVSLNILNFLDVVRRTGKRGNLYVYESCF